MIDVDNDHDPQRQSNILLATSRCVVHSDSSIKVDLPDPERII